MSTCRSAVLAILAAVVSYAPASFADSVIDVTKAVRVKLPGEGEFTTPDGKKGWVKRLSSQTIPTPAYSKGRLFTGTGMSASTFLAINASTGETIWEKSTKDNGPTSAVADDRYVSYNTESCDTETRDIDSGDIIWNEVTGGTLLTAPVIASNMLIIPHPTMQRKAQMADDAFRMLGCDLKTGKHKFDANMTGDVLAAPVAASGKVFFTCTDGRLFCISLPTGGSDWHVVANATSAPVVVGDLLAVTTEEPTTLGGATVSIRRYTVADGDLLDEKPLCPTSVGNPVKKERAEWDYQGPKIAANGKQLFCAPGQTINSLDITTGKSLWRSTVVGNGVSNAANMLTPPAVGKSKLYLGTAQGDVIAVNQRDGSLAFAYNVGQPLASQPLLVDGNIYFGTASGFLVCIKLNDTDAAGWTAWGGNAQHNKVN
jgi:outer membrane protein assembly factor BamB